ncbi:MAG: DUF350 domain-containing protein [Bradymonadia bacterium]
MENGAVEGILTRFGENLPADLAYVGLAVVLLIVARLVKDWLTPYALTEELTTKDNTALGLSVAGYYGGVLLTCIGPMSSPPVEGVALWEDLLLTGGYALGGIIMLNAARVLVDLVVLRDFSTVKEIITDQNAGTGAVEMGVYLALGLIMCGALHGQGGGPHTALGMAAIGMVGLILYGAIYRAVCGYDLHGEIERDNVAAGVALGLNLVAAGVILMKGMLGDFLDWPTQLTQFGLTFALGSILLLVLRVLVDVFILPGVKVKDEIVKDRNLNAAWVEGVVLTGVSGMLVMIL